MESQSFMVDAGTVGKQPSTGLDRGKGILSEEFNQLFQFWWILESKVLIYSMKLYSS